MQVDGDPADANGNKQAIDTRKRQRARDTDDDDEADGKETDSDQEPKKRAKKRAPVAQLLDADLPGDAPDIAGKDFVDGLGKARSLCVQQSQQQQPFGGGAAVNTVELPPGSELLLDYGADGYWRALAKDIKEHTLRTAVLQQCELLRPPLEALLAGRHPGAPLMLV